MTAKKLKTILENHREWLVDNRKGEKADLSGADLSEANLRGAYLYGANLIGADLIGADLRKATLTGADLNGANLNDAYLDGACLFKANLRGVNLRKANLREATLTGVDLTEADLTGAYLAGTDLRGANLRKANLFGTDLSRAGLCCADLSGADLNGADLFRANLNEAKNVPFLPMVPPESGSFVGWKKAGGKIVKLLIPEDAKRSSATSRKCRCDKAKVLAIENLDGKKTKIKKIASDYSRDFVYEVGKTVEVPDFCENRWQECAPGIHFFVSRREAVEYLS